MSDQDFKLLQEFLQNPDKYSNVYGSFTLTHADGRDAGCLIVNNKGEKDIGYFIEGDLIGSHHYSRYRAFMLTKKERGTGLTVTLEVPASIAICALACPATPAGEPVAWSPWGIPPQKTY